MTLFRQGNSMGDMPIVGKAPAVLLCHPKYPHNVGAILRTCSCYGIGQLWISGDRVPISTDGGYRLPREERMRGYADVMLVKSDVPFTLFPPCVTPVAVEVRDAAESLPAFEHPANPLYVFGPEDGNIPQVWLRHCHRFVRIPTAHCLNLSVAVATVLYDRLQKAVA